MSRRGWWSVRDRAVAIGLTFLLVSGCQTTASPQPTQAGPALVVSPAALLLTHAGDSHALVARFEGGANPVASGAVTWKSSDSSVATVDPDGTVHAIARLGSAQVTASIGKDESDPVLVTIATPATGVQLIRDDQITTGPTLVDTGQPVDTSTPFEVVLSGLASAPAPGTLLLGAEGRTLGGRVVSATADGGDVRVRMVTAPLSELLAAFDVSTHLDLATALAAPAPELAKDFAVTQDGRTFDFSQKPIAAQAGGLALAAYHPAAPAPRLDLASGGAQGTVALPPMPPFKECKASAEFGSGLPVPLALSGSLLNFQVTPGGTADWHAASGAAGESDHVVIDLHLTPTITASTELKVAASFEAKIECKLTLLRTKFRAPGWAGLLLGGTVDFGAGFSIGGKVNLANATLGGKLTIHPDYTGTLTCPGGPILGGVIPPCSLNGNVSATSDFKPTLEAPSLSQASFEPSVQLFGFAAIEAGNADIDALQFEAVEAKAGPELAASLSLESLQMAASDPSKYGLTFKGELGPGLKLEDFLGSLLDLKKLGVGEVKPVKLSFEASLGTSPTGVTMTTDKPRYLPGDAVKVHVKLDPDSTVFPQRPITGPYNVKSVAVVRKDGVTSTETLASVDAADGQTEFDLTFTSTHVIDASDLAAFVVTRLLPLDPPKLKVGAAAAASRIAFTGPNAPSFSDFRIVVTDAGGKNPVVLQTGVGAWSPALSPDGTKIAFLGWSGSGCGQCAADVYTADIDAAGKLSNVTDVTPGDTDSVQYPPAWSPDGKQLAYARQHAFGPLSSTWELIVMKSDGSGASAVLRRSGDKKTFPIGPPAWSPDGKKIAFVGVEDGAAQQMAVETIDLSSGGTGGPQVGTTFRQGGLPNPATWSPDGSTIAFSCGNPTAPGTFGICLVKSGALQFIAGLRGSPAWSPDGSQIATVSRNGLSIMTVATGAITTAPVSGNDASNFSISWGTLPH